MSLFRELRRRNVVKVAVAYAVIAWLVMQVIVTVEAPLRLPDWFDTAIIVLLIIGFPVTLLVAWAFELTPEGIRRTGSEEIVEVASAQPGDPNLNGSPPENSIAVLPFADMSPERDQEYFSDGISEELLNLLARVPELRVIARTSSFYYKDKDLPLTRIARELNVAHILEGSVRKAGDRVRITTQLVRTSDSTHLWSDTFDRTLEDIFAIQDQVAAAVVRQLKIKLLGDIPTTTPVKPEAYKLFLRGKHATTQGSFPKAITLYQQAVELDPDFADAWASLGMMQAVLMHSRNLVENAEPARQAAGRALAIDPDNGTGHAALGWIALVQDDLADAARYLEQAFAMEPDMGVISGTTMLLAALGRLEQAIEIATYAAAKDPVNASAYVMLANWYLYTSQWDDAIRAARSALELNPVAMWAHCALGLSLLAKGELKQALTEVEQEAEERFRLECLAMIHHGLGDRGQSDAALLRLVEKFDSQASLIARAYAYRGEADQAFLWLDRAIENHESLLRNYIHSPFFANLHNDARWLPFLERLGSSPSQLARIEFNFSLPK